MKTVNKPSSVFHLVWNAHLYDDKSSLIADYQTQDSGLDWSSIINGKAVLKEWKGNFTVYSKGNSHVDYFIAGGYYNMVSNKVKKIMQDITKGNNIEFIPAKVLTINSHQDCGEYWVMNVTNNVEALDWHQTIWKTESIPNNIEKAYAEIIKPALMLEKVKDHHIFHLAVIGKTKPGIYISNILKNKLEIAQCTIGMQFSPVKVL